jgi:regulator of CtrA degradation
MNAMLGEVISGFDDCSTFAGSVMFDRTYREGMALVEETARYLDGRGRTESDALPRRAALLYASESLRVTTRLLQAASWLLVQRAVHEGDMRVEDAARDRYRLGSKDICLGELTDGMECLPPKLQDLLKRSAALYQRIARLDEILFGVRKGQGDARSHLSRLEEAFAEVGV